MGKIYKVNVSGIEMKYGVFGTGKRNLALIPGLNVTSVADLVDAVEKQYEKFTSDFTIYLFDRKDNVKPGYTMEEMALDTLAVMKSISTDKWDLMGTSQGGFMSMVIAEKAPELINNLLLVSTSFISNDISTPIFKEWIELAKNRKKEELGISFAKYVYTKDLFDVVKPIMIEQSKTYTDKDLDKFIIITDTFFNGINIKENADKIVCKAMVMGSKADGVFGSAALEEISDTLKCPILLYPSNYGHGVYDENPEFVADAYNYFMK